MLFLNQRTKLKEDAIIGLIFTSFFGLGLFMVSLSPTSVNIQTIVLGNILAITPEDTLQLAIIGFVSLAVLLVKWKDLMVVFFDESHARSIGLNPTAAARSSSSRCSSASHGGGAADGRRLPRHRHGGHARRHRLSADRPLPAADRSSPSRSARSPASSAPMSATSSTARPAASSSCLQTLVFLIAFVFAPKHGMLAARRRAARGTGGDGHDLLDTLLLPFQFEFMRNALIISVLVAIPTALLSCFLVLKGWSLMGDAISPRRPSRRRHRLHRRLPARRRRLRRRHVLRARDRLS